MVTLIASHKLRSLPLVLWHFWLVVVKSIWPVKNEW